MQVLRCFVFSLVDTGLFSLSKITPPPPKKKHLLPKVNINWNIKKRKLILFHLVAKATFYLV